MVGPATRYTVGAATVTAVAGGTVAVSALGTGANHLGWLVAGWLLATGIGVEAGACLATLHGRPGVLFVFVIVAVMMARLLAVAGGAVGAAVAGGGALRLYLGGFASAFVPLSVYEGIWFHRASRPTGASAIPGMTGPHAGGR